MAQLMVEERWLNIFLCADLRKLSREEKVLGLVTAWETADFQFFQYQVLVRIIHALFVLRPVI